MLLKSLFFLLLFSSLSLAEDIIIDSEMTFEQAIKGTQAPDSIIKNLILLNVEYYSFDNKLHRGQLVVHKKLEQDLKEIFQIIKNNKFPIAKVIPIVKYDWSDDLSMEDNNTSSFNYRKVARKNTLSKHSFGIAIDINPYLNPAVYNDGKISPRGSKYDKNTPGTIVKDSLIYNEFIKRGWIWGGEWNSLKDYQHFEKNIR